MKKILSIISLVAVVIILLYRISEARKRKQARDTLEAAFRYTKSVPDATKIYYEEIYGFPSGIKLMYQHNKKQGLFDSVSNKVLVPMKYDDISYFGGEYMTSFRQDDKYGFLDTLGHEVVPAMYELVHGFDDGLAAVKLNGKWGFINKENKMVIPAKYEFAHDFYTDRAAVKLNSKWGFINHSGNYMIKPVYDDVIWPLSKLHPKAKVGIKGKYILIDKNGKFLGNTDSEFIASD